MPSAGTNVSIERDVFPTLVERGLYGFEQTGYWLDIGTPDRYLKGTYDILEGKVEHRDRSGAPSRGADADRRRDRRGESRRPCLPRPGLLDRTRALVGDRSVLGEEVSIGEGARVESSVLLAGVTVGAGTTISGSIVGRDVQIGEQCQIGGGVVLGEGVRIGSGNTLAAGARIFPGVELPDGAIKF